MENLFTPKKLILSLALFLAAINVFAQAPNIHYSSPQVYKVNVPISPLSPTNTGGAITYSQATIASGFNNLNGMAIAVDGAHNIYVAEAGANDIKKIPAGGGSPVTIGGGFNHPTGVAADAAGNVYVADSGNNAVKEIPVGAGAVLLLASGFTPHSVAVDSAGNVFVGSYWQNNQVEKIPAGGGTPVIIDSGSDGVAVDAAGNIYVAQTNHNLIDKVLPNGCKIPFSTGLYRPICVAVDPAGNVYFTAPNNNNALMEIPAGGGSIVSLGSGFSNPTGVAVDGSGNIYVADNGNSAVKKITFNGHYTISPVLPSGFNFDSHTGIIRGAPDITSPAANYTVTATNSGGSSMATINIAIVRPQKPNISYSGPQVYSTGVPKPPLTPSNSGGRVGKQNSFTLAARFNVLSGIAVDAAGNVYAAEKGGNDVKKIAAGGAGVSVIGAGFNGPTGVAVDAAGNVFVADYGNGVIKKIPAGGGAIVTVGPAFQTPYGIALDAAGNIYVTDKSNNSVKKMPPGGGTPVTIGAGFSSPMDIAVDAAGNVYVGDRGHKAIVELTVGGGALILGSGNVSGLTVDAGGNVYFGDDTNHLEGIWRIPAGGGTPVVEFPPKFSRPGGLAIDNFGNIYVANPGASDIIEINAGGYFIHPALPEGLTFHLGSGIISGTPMAAHPATNYTIDTYNAGGISSTTVNIAVAPYQHPSVSYQSPQVYTTGVTITPLAPASSNVSPFGTRSSPVTFASGFNHPTGIAIDGAGNVYVAETGNNAIKKIPAGGGSVVTLVYDFSQPMGLAIDAAGNIYVADYGNNAIKEIPAAGGAVVTLGSGFNHPYGIAVDNSGNIYVGDSGNNVVKKMPAGGGTPVSIGSGFNSPEGVAVDASGNVYVADYGNGALKKIPAGGGSTIILAHGLVGYPVAVDDAGNVYFPGDAVNGSITELLASGGSTAVGFGFGAGGVAVDGAGNVYVTDNGTVKVVNPGGYFTKPVLPAGLSFNRSTGVISGTPTGPSPAKNYTVTAYNNGGSGTAIVNIQVVTDSTALAHLTLSSGTLAPAFSPDSTNYTAYVSNATTSITETPTVALAGTTVKVNGTTVASGSASGSIPLAVGPNTITTVVTSPNGSMTKTYTVTVNRLDVYLSNLKINNGAIPLNPAFIFSTNNYTASVPNATTSVKITPKLAYTGSSVTVNGTPVASGTASGPITLAVGPNTITTVVTGADGTTTNTYTVTVTRISSNANLSNLVLSSGTLSPAFASGTTSYTASVNTASVTVTPTTSDATATVKINGTTVASGTPSGSIALAIGSNTITTVVTAQDGTTTKTYTITVTRLSTNAYLTNLKINNGSVPLNPSFIYTTTSYTASVPNSTSSVKMLPGAADPNATIKVNGSTVASGTASPDIALSVGSNTVNTVVTAQDGTTTRTYTVTITRISSNANLSNLALSSGTLSPAFASGTTSYTASVNTASVKVTPTTSDATATVKVNGTTVASGSASGSIALAIGSNTITTVVTAQDGTTTKTYTITVTRLSTNDYLTNLKINNGSVPLNPSFIYTTTSYTASVPNATSSVKMLPGAADPNATIKVNGSTVASGTASPDIALSVGSNTVNTVVTAQDGTTTKTYTVTITRGAPMHAENSVYQSVGVEKPIESAQLETDGIVVHQGVSPNGDGMNDVLLVDGISNYPDNRLMIMNRSGQLIYEVKGYDNSSKVFDGHSNKTGAKQLPGTYFYSLDYMVKGVSKHKTGFIVLKY